MHLIKRRCDVTYFTYPMQVFNYLVCEGSIMSKHLLFKSYLPIKNYALCTFFLSDGKSQDLSFQIVKYQERNEQFT